MKKEIASMCYKEAHRPKTIGFFKPSYSDKTVNTSTHWERLLRSDNLTGRKARHIYKPRI